MEKQEGSLVPPIEANPEVTYDQERSIFMNLSRAELRQHAQNYFIPDLDDKGEQKKDSEGNFQFKPQAEPTNKIIDIDGVETVVPGGPLRFMPRINSRSTEAKHYVESESTSGKIWEAINKPMSQEAFASLKNDMREHLNGSNTYVIDAALGMDIDPENAANGRQVRQKVRFVTNSPIHALFASMLYADLTPEEFEESQREGYTPDLTINHSPDFTADPDKHGTKGKEVISFNYDEREILIGGTDYLGEIKKAGFTWMHHAIDELNTKEEESAAFFKAVRADDHDTTKPKRSWKERALETWKTKFAGTKEFFTSFVSHASAVQKKDGTVAVLFGGSGAGKSSAPPEVTEAKQHEGYEVVWDDEGVVTLNIAPKMQENGEETLEIKSESIQIEGGAYVTLSNAHNEDKLMELLQREDVLIESVEVDERGVPDYKNTTKTTNIRGAAHISRETFKTFKESGVSGPVKDFVFLVPDTRGILPPVAKFRNHYQTMLYALVGPGSKIPGREQGVQQIEEKFAPLNDEPFLPFHPTRSIDSLMAIMDTNDINGWIVSSGWKKGPVGVSERMSVPETQAAVGDITEGVMDSIDDKDWIADPIFGWKIHKKYVDANLWEDKEAFEKSREEYAEAIINFVTETYPLDSHPEMAYIHAELPKLPNKPVAPIEIFNAHTDRMAA